MVNFTQTCNYNEPANDSRRRRKQYRVFIPYNEWNKLKKPHRDLADLEPKEPSKEEILDNIRKGLKEVDIQKRKT